MIENKNEPFVSVIINCFNGEKYLQDALDSVAAQTFSNYEIIFWDNQSTDSTSEIVKKYNDSRMRYFFAANQSTLGEARNLAVEQARGTWIAFLDCDDIWVPEKLEIQVNLIAHSSHPDKVGMVYGRTFWLKNDGTKGDYTSLTLEKKPLPSGKVLKDLLITDRIISMSSGVIRRDLFWKVGGIPTEYKQAEDLYIFCAIASEFEVLAANELCCYYRIHDSNLTLSQRALTFHETVSVINRFADHPSMATVEGLLKRRKLELYTYAALMTVRYEKKILSGLKLLLSKGSVPKAFIISYQQIFKILKR